MKKRILTLAMALVVVLGISVTPTLALPALAASTGVKVILDGNLMTFDVPPQIINNRTMVPLRAIFEAMGAKVDWVGETQTVTGTKDDTVVILKIGDTSPTINGIVVPIDQPAVIKENRTLAPLRFVAEAFGGTVDWEGSTQTAFITMGSATPETTPETTPGVSIDVALAGWKWFCMMPRIIQKQVGTEMTFVTEVVTDSYMFFSDGTFFYFPYSERFIYYEGTYSASDGKLHLISTNRRNRETDEIVNLSYLTIEPEIKMEYEITSDAQGTYLHIGSFQMYRATATVELSDADIYMQAESVDKSNADLYRNAE